MKCVGGSYRALTVGQQNQRHQAQPADTCKVTSDSMNLPEYVRFFSFKNDAYIP